MYTIVLFAIIGGVFGAYDERRRVQTTTYLGTDQRVRGHHLEIAIIFAVLGIGFGILTAGFAGSRLPRREVQSSAFALQCLSAPACQLPSSKSTTIRQIEDPTLKGHSVLKATISKAVVPPAFAKWVIVTDTNSLELRIPKPQPKDH